jgi:hypothetical protein
VIFVHAVLERFATIDEYDRPLIAVLLPQSSIIIDVDLTKYEVGPSLGMR